MSALFILIFAAWAALIAVAIIVSCATAVFHFLPRRVAPWSLPLAPIVLILLLLGGAVLILALPALLGGNPNILPPGAFTS